MNFTIDDTSPQLIYSTGGWGTQSPADTRSSEFFQRTYHAAQTDGASMNMTVSGSAVYLYGSRGPSHVGILLYLSRTYKIDSRFRETIVYSLTGPLHSSPPMLIRLSTNNYYFHIHSTILPSLHTSYHLLHTSMAPACVANG